MFKIAIDGFMGSGKSTLAKGLCKKLEGFRLLDTGAIFRGMAVVFARLKEDIVEDNLKDFVEKTKVEVCFNADEQHIIVNGEDVTAYLRTEAISQIASKISIFPCIREKYLEIAKEFSRSYNCIMEGRDIGSVVMPDADVKIFLTANENLRAKRRYDEAISKGQNVVFQDVLSDLQERDARDSTRTMAPLKPMEDSIIVDNSDMSLEETVEYCYKIIRNKMKIVNIAIDGYVCSGKSTIAVALAKSLGYNVFNTGSLYRAIACRFKDLGYNESNLNENFMKDFAKNIQLQVQFDGDLQRVIVNGVDYTPNLRTEEIGLLTAKISPFLPIREKVLEMQRNFANSNSIVMEGRDIGSEVLPNADFKFFCTASEEVRAQRRYEQQKASGISYEKVLEDLRKRDYQDSHREHGAIKLMPDSIILDTTNQTLQQSIEFCLQKIKERQQSDVTLTN